MNLEERLPSVNDIDPQAEDYVEQLDAAFLEWRERHFDLVVEGQNVLHKANLDTQKYAENAALTCPDIRFSGDEIITRHTSGNNAEVEELHAKIAKYMRAVRIKTEIRGLELVGKKDEAEFFMEEFTQALVQTTTSHYLQDPTVVFGKQSKAMIYLTLGDQVYSGIATVGSGQLPQIEAFGPDITLQPGDLDVFPSDDKVFPTMHSLDINCYAHFRNDSRVLDAERLFYACAKGVGADVDQRMLEGMKGIPLDKRIKMGFIKYALK